MCEREWWKKCVRTSLEGAGCNTFTSDQFDRYFRSVYQYFGSRDAYSVLSDATEFLKWLESQRVEELPHRSHNPKVVAYQPWLTPPDSLDVSILSEVENDLPFCTVRDLVEETHKWDPLAISYLHAYIRVIHDL
eukprot:gene27480-34202_t